MENAPEFRLKIQVYIKWTSCICFRLSIAGWVWTCVLPGALLQVGRNVLKMPRFRCFDVSLSSASYTQSESASHNITTIAVIVQWLGPCVVAAVTQVRILVTAVTVFFFICTPQGSSKTENPYWTNSYPSVGGIVVSIAAFQAVDPGSIPGRRNLFFDFSHRNISHLATIANFLSYSLGSAVGSASVS